MKFRSVEAELVPCARTDVLDRLSKNIQIPGIMKFRSVDAELVPCARTDVTKQSAASHNLANAPKLVMAVCNVYSFQTVHPRCVYITSLDEMQENSHIHNKLLYWIKYATKTCFGLLLWGHHQV